MDISSGNKKQKLTMIKRISITGPECTGKTWLSKKLAGHYHTSWVPEYSVEYLQKKGSTYSIEDILNIAKGQLYSEDKFAENTNAILFCDTDMLVNKIWSKKVFGEVPGWIDSMVSEHMYDLYLLCFPDIMWRPGPFRENPDDREILFRLYEQELIKHEFPYKIVTGDGEQRFKNAVNFVDELL